jgi:hypothetical protein
LDSLRLEQLGIRVPRDSDELKLIGICRQQLERLSADGTGGA